MTKYMHTLDGQPASWDAKDQYIHLVGKYGQAAVMANSLKELRRQQEIDILEHGTQHGMKYGYVRVSA